jgi:hypothetical protein
LARRHSMPKRAARVRRFAEGVVVSAIAYLPCQ